MHHHGLDSEPWAQTAIIWTIGPTTLAGGGDKGLWGLGHHVLSLEGVTVAQSSFLSPASRSLGETPAIGGPPIREDRLPGHILKMVGEEACTALFPRTIPPSPSIPYFHGYSSSGCALQWVVEHNWLSRIFMALLLVWQADNFFLRQQAREGKGWSSKVYNSAEPQQNFMGQVKGMALPYSFGPAIFQTPSANNGGVKASQIKSVCMWHTYVYQKYVIECIC